MVNNGNNDDNNGNEENKLNTQKITIAQNQQQIQRCNDLVPLLPKLTKY